MLAVVLLLCCVGGVGGAGFLIVRSADDDSDDPDPGPAATAPDPAETSAADPGPVEETEGEPIGQDGGTQLSIGETGTYSEQGVELGQLTVTDTERFDEPRSSLGRPPEEDEFLMVTVQARATGDEVFTINPFDFSLRDGAGDTYLSGDGAALFAVDEAMLNHTNLSPGDQVTGVLVFDVPAGPLELVYEPLLEPLAYWEIP